MEQDTTSVADRPLVIKVLSDGRKSLTIGDLHFSDVYTGRHHNYLQNGIDIIDMYTESMIKNKIEVLILTGDLIGQSQKEKNLVHRETILYMVQVLQKWNELTNGNVYSVKGNHDHGRKMTDFEMFVGMRLIQVVDQLDVGKTRFHFVHFGDEDRALNVDPDYYNIAITHTDIQISGLTTWYYSKGGIELSTMSNFKGVSLVIGGHIHNPSPRLLTTSIEGEEIALIYPGNATRPKSDNRWETCLGLLTSELKGDVLLDQVTYQLKPCDEIFALTFDDMADTDEEPMDTAPVIDIEELSKILEELQAFNISGMGDYYTQIKRFAGLDQEAAELAIKYIENVESTFQN